MYLSMKSMLSNKEVNKAVDYPLTCKNLISDKGLT